jgi:hypothetical protein
LIEIDTDNQGSQVTNIAEAKSPIVLKMGPFDDAIFNEDDEKSKISNRYWNFKIKA